MCEQHYLLWLRDNREPNIPAELVAKHVERLRKAGLSWAHIATLSGISGRTAQRVGKHKTVKLATAKGILSVTPPELPYSTAQSGDLVPAVGTLRRLRGLIAMGYTNEFLASEMGVTKDHFSKVSRDRSPHVTAGTARKAEEIFRRLQVNPVPDSYQARRTRLRAWRKGWLPPFSWDEDTIDDPAAEPFIPTEKADWFDSYEELQEMGLTDPQISVRLGKSVDAIKARLKRRAA